MGERPAEGGAVLDGGASRSRSFAEKLEYLFQTVHPAGRGSYTNREVAEALLKGRADGGPTISETYLWQLRRGVKDNPTMRHLEALARFFGVPPAYFFSDAQAEEARVQLALVVALRDSGVRQVALRAAGLSHVSLQSLTEVIGLARRLEGLPVDAEADTAAQTAGATRAAEAAEDQPG